MKVITAACGVQSEQDRVPLYEIGAPSKALRWRCLEKTEDKFGCITLDLSRIQKGVTDWSAARELWILIDASAYAPDTARLRLFFHSNGNWGLKEQGAQVMLYDLGCETWSLAMPRWFSVVLPAHFRGWARLPLQGGTFSSVFWEPARPFDALDLGRVDQLSLGLEQGRTAAEGTADFLRFVLRMSPWHEGDGLPGTTGPWQEIVPLDVLDTGVRLSEDNDRQNWGQDNNRLAGISFSAEIIARPGRYSLVRACAPLLLQIREKRILLSPQQLLLGEAYTARYLCSNGPPLMYDHVQFALEPGEMEPDDGWGWPLDEAVAVSDPAVVAGLLQRLAALTAQPADASLTTAYLRCLLDYGAAARQRTAGHGKSRCNKALYMLRYRLYEDPCAAASIAQVAEELKLSASGVQHAYKRLFGCSYTTDVIASRIRHAQRLLAETALPVAAVAERCGYETLSYFMRQFKQHTGRSPGAYRQEQTMISCERLQ